MNDFTKLLTAAAALALCAPAAFAQGAAPAATASANVTAGAKVKDQAGGEVGTIEKVEGDIATLSTGTSKVAVPTSSFGVGPDALILGMTKAEVDAAAAGAAAKATADTQAQIAAGTEVKGKAGESVGKIEAVDAQFVTLAMGSAKIKLPRAAFGAGPNGLMVSMTKAELEAAAKSAGSATTANN
jgi:hypothetical protein